ncbi:hypothetical protein IWQ48_004620 [Labrenzia sp. EL_13]|uniref:DUF2336 domain-containing protein n=1 Tax=Roseibium album TaxID=311410 RepID=UPI000CF0B701|nr:DUF2336 domain-containing protein [Roseibium album]MBG6143160.1 hypothetical protein [Labrenzia sp. EL_142]MBG6166448.1 hypothetical protein [Labrenzia sp. EL_195]MBG6203463.1 hypothetical protein [Labrenzia sp. EL_13]MBG6205943.1 hypothetical protein [Labrenzia sp. EL_126]
MIRDQLEQLARISEPEARSKLIRALVGEYARSEENEPTEVERELFSRIVLSVFDQLDKEARYELVVRLAKTDRIIPDLADRLAQEDYELSEPVIECSPMISQPALMRIARTGGNDKRLSVARRPDLNEEISDTLVARSSRDVVHALLDNKDAPFSVKGTLALLIFANTEIEVLAGIAKRALKDEEFLETQKLVLETNCPLIPAPLRKALETGDLERLATTIGDLERDGDIEIDGVLYSRHEASIHIANGEMSFDAILRTLFEDDRIDAAIWLIGRKLNLSDDVVADTLKSDADGAIMRLMLQTGIDEKTYRDFLKARCKWLDRNSRTIPELVMRYKAELKKPRANADASFAGSVLN